MQIISELEINSTVTLSKDLTLYILEKKLVSKYFGEVSLANDYELVYFLSLDKSYLFELFKKERFSSLCCVPLIAEKLNEFLKALDSYTENIGQNNKRKFYVNLKNTIESLFKQPNYYVELLITKLDHFLSNDLTDFEIIDETFHFSANGKRIFHKLSSNESRALEFVKQITVDYKNGIECFEHISEDIILNISHLGLFLPVYLFTCIENGDELFIKYVNFVYQNSICLKLNLIKYYIDWLKITHENVLQYFQEVNHNEFFLKTLKRLNRIAKVQKHLSKNDVLLEVTQIITRMVKQFNRDPLKHIDFSILDNSPLIKSEYGAFLLQNLSCFSNALDCSSTLQIERQDSLSFEDAIDFYLPYYFLIAEGGDQLFINFMNYKIRNSTPEESYAYIEQQITHLKDCHFRVSNHAHPHLLETYNKALERLESIKDIYKPPEMVAQVAAIVSQKPEDTYDCFADFIKTLKEEEKSVLYSAYMNFYAILHKYLNTSNGGKGFRGLLFQELGFFGLENTKETRILSFISLVYKDFLRSGLDIQSHYRYHIIEDVLSFFTICRKTKTSQRFAKHKERFDKNRAIKTMICNGKTLLDAKLTQRILETFLEVKLSEYKYHIAAAFQDKNNNQQERLLPCFFIYYKNNLPILKPINAYFDNKGTLRSLFTDNGIARAYISEVIGMNVNEDDEIVITLANLESLREVLNNQLDDDSLPFILLEEKSFHPIKDLVVASDAESLANVKRIKRLRKSKHYSLAQAVPDGEEKITANGFWQKTSLIQCRSIQEKSKPFHSNPVNTTSSKGKEKIIDDLELTMTSLDPLQDEQEKEKEQISVFPQASLQEESRYSLNDTLCIPIMKGFLDRSSLAANFIMDNLEHISLIEDLKFINDIFAKDPSLKYKMRNEGLKAMPDNIRGSMEKLYACLDSAIEIRQVTSLRHVHIYTFNSHEQSFNRTNSLYTENANAESLKLHKVDPQSITYDILIPKTQFP